VSFIVAGAECSKSLASSQYFMFKLKFPTREKADDRRQRSRTSDEFFWSSFKVSTMVQGVRIDRCVDRRSSVVKAATVADHMTVHQLIPVSAVRYPKVASSVVQFKIIIIFLSTAPNKRGI
jgi:hypothetical protein